MLKGLADGLADEFRTGDGPRPRLEGTASDGWLLMDFGDIIVHIFSKERRNYYRLEELWSDSKILIHLQ